MKQLFFLFLFLLCAASTSVLAASSPWQEDQDMAVRLVSARDTTGQLDEIYFGLEIRLVDEGHTYWRSPGSSGMPPTLDWTGSKNLESATLLYPAPIRFGIYPMDTIGYQGHVLFPLHIKLQKIEEPLVLKVKLDLLICHEICLPKNFDLTLSLPKGDDTPSVEEKIINAARARLPKDAANSSLHIVNASTQDDTLTLKIESDQALHAPDLFLESTPELFFKNPTVSIDSGGKSALFKAQLESPLKKDEKINLSTINVTLINGEETLTQSLRLVAQDIPNALPLWCILLLALLGGFLLNFMPCVLPVLSLKIFALVRHGRKGKRVIRRAFLSTAAGILFSFLLLASVTVALKASGQAIGWGVQFQQPVFLVFMIVVLTFFAANMWGFFEFGLPRFLQHLLDTTRHPKLAGDFASGALATLLATPCSAPFLGTAISFALAAGGFEIFSVFGALGIGMTLPYLLIAVRPRLASFFPSPGQWMARLSQLLGYGLIGTAVWLLFILDAQIGKIGASFIGLGISALLGFLALRHLGILRWFFYPLLTLIISSIFYIAIVATIPETLATKNSLWKSFDETKIEKNIREGKIVFVDVTANWCLTCKLNKRFALSDDKVTQKLFHNERFIAMQADWTNPDPVITEFLRKHGRFGVPFNMIFSQRFPQGHALPELLTPSIILNALKKACPVDLRDGNEC